MKRLLLLLLLLLGPTLVWGEDFSGQLGSVNPEQTITLNEDFMSGFTGSNTIGALGWSFGVSGGGAVTITNVADVANHPAGRNISLSAVLNSIGVFNLGNFGANWSTATLSELFDTTWVVRPQSNTDQELRIGSGIIATAASPPTNGIYFEQDTGGANPTVWQCVTRSLSTSTTTVTAITVSNATWYKLRIHRSALTNVAFYIDGVLACTHTTNVPSGVTANNSFVIQIENLAALAAKNIDIDSFNLKITGLTR